MFFLLHKPTQFSSVPWPTGLSGGREWDDSAKILFQSFLWEAIVSNSGMGRDVHSLMLFTAPSPLTTVSTALHGALRCGFGEAVMALTCPKYVSFHLFTANWWWWLLPHAQGLGENVWQFIPCLCFSFLFFFKVEISSHTLIQLFRPGSVLSGSVS